jgi:hypothetical protein
MTEFSAIVHFFNEINWIFFVYLRYSTLLHLPPLRFHCVGGCWYRTQDRMVLCFLPALLPNCCES